LEIDKSIAIDSTVKSFTTNSKASDNDLPSMDVLEDVFKTRGVWEKAIALHNRGLTWSQVASELISACEK
jgi:hypothetical protein